METRLIKAGAAPPSYSDFSRNMDSAQQAEERCDRCIYRLALLCLMGGIVLCLTGGIEYGLKGEKRDITMMVIGGLIAFFGAGSVFVLKKSR